VEKDTGKAAATAALRTKKMWTYQTTVDSKSVPAVRQQVAAFWH